MTPATFASYVRFLTHTNSTTLPDSTLLSLMAARFDYLASRIIEVDEGYFGVPEFADIVNGQREYALPSDILSRVKVVEFSPDSGTTWIRMLPLSLSSYNRTTDESTIQNNFSNVQDDAFYEIFRGSLWLYTGALSGFSPGNQALKIWAYDWPNPPASLTDGNSNTDMSIPLTSTQSVIPRNFHYCLALLVSIDYKNSFDKPIALNQQELAVDVEINKACAQIVPASTENAPTGQLPDRNHTYNDGFDL